jgi:aryl-alcohol dehydrogenase-like predicted oxidoreductase
LESRLIFGTAQLTSMRSFYDIKKLLNAVRDAGINELDTARGYGGGYCEYVIGKYLSKECGAFKINTKVGFGKVRLRKLPIRLVLPAKFFLKKYIVKSKYSKNESQLDHVPIVKIERLDFEYMKNSIELSFKLLGTDYLNALFIHELIPEELDNQSLDFLFEIKRQGRVGRLGIGADARKVRLTNTLEGFDICQYQYSHYQEMKLQFPQLSHNCFGVLSGVRNPSGNNVDLALSALGHEDKIVFNTSKIHHLPQQR